MGARSQIPQLVLLNVNKLCYKRGDLRPGPQSQDVSKRIWQTKFLKKILDDDEESEAFRKEVKMKILNDLSVKDLKLNKKRSIVIIIGIILSTALICGVAGLVTSFQKTFIETAKRDNGNYHVMFYNVPKAELKYIEENRNVEDYYLYEELGCSYLQDSKLDEKPTVNVIAMNDKALNNMGITLEEGSLPENEDEIVISKRINQVCMVDYKVGNTITLNINENEHTYKIVGIIERPSTLIESYDVPWYSVITKMEEIKEKANIAVLYKDVFKYQEITESINHMVKAKTAEEKEEGTTFYGMRDETYTSYKYEIGLNTDLLAYEGANLSQGFISTIYGLGAFIIAIVLVSSVIVIRNGFAISITERLKQYGMLSSIGATKKQIKKSVYFEGFILGIIGIPLGILSGILAIFVLVNLVNFILKDYVSSGTLLVYSISWIAIVISVLVSIVTIWLSCKSSARKASKVTPIEAIRSSQDIKLNAKKMKCPKIITKLFKTGGEIAYKNLKRSRKKYRTTVISIIVSVVIFIAISSFIEYGFKMSSAYYTELSYNYAVYCREYDDTVTSEEERMQEENENLQILLDISKLENIEKFAIPKSTNLEFKKNDEYEQQLTDFGKEIKLNTVQYSQKDGEEIDVVNIVSLGKEEYERYLKKIGGNYEDYKNGAILLDNNIAYDQEGKTIQGSIYKWKKGDTVSGKINDKDYSIKIVDKTEERPMGLDSMYSTNAYLIISDELMESIGNYYVSGLYIQSNSPDELDKEINQYINSNEIKEEYLYIANMEESVRAENAIVLVISIFLYGFIAVITLIGITNIFNTITTNMSLRKKEFAILKSIGMTKKEFNRMIRLESILYGIKSLIIGIPIGILLSYGMYNVFNNNMGMEYKLPIKAILIAVVFVAIVISIIMKYSMSKINKQNIIETIRNDNI